MRAYRVPAAAEAQRVATTWADVRDYDWKRIPLALRDAPGDRRQPLPPDDDPP